MIPRRARSKAFSEACYRGSNASKGQNVTSESGGPKTYVRCGLEFVAYRSWQRFCSPKCRYRHHNEKAPVSRGGVEALVRRVVRDELMKELKKRKSLEEER